MDIYVQKDGQQCGPFLETRIREGIDAGEFVPTDLAWTQGKASWQPLSMLLNLDTTHPPPFAESLNLVPPPFPISAPQTTSALPRRQNEPFSSKIYKVIAYALMAIVLLFFSGRFLWIYLNAPRSSGDDIFQLKKSTPTPDDWKFLDTPANRTKNNHHPFQTFSDVPRANLLGTEQEFVKVYGQPIRKEPSSKPSGAEIVYFSVNNDLIYSVSFWQEQAHQVIITRRDHLKLTDDEIKQGLAAFSGGEKWERRVPDQPYRSDFWVRSGTGAWVVLCKKVYPDKNADIPETMLTVSTEQFAKALDEAVRNP